MSIDRRAFLARTSQLAALTCTTAIAGRAWARHPELYGPSGPAGADPPDFKVNVAVPGPVRTPLRHTINWGQDSSDPSTVLMFRGNPAHTHYGSGRIADRYKIGWTLQCPDYPAILHGNPHVWRGPGWSGQASVLGNRVLIGTTSRYLYCLDRETGGIAWKIAAQRMFKSSCCIYRDRAYIGCVDDHLRCIDVQSGHIVWQWNTGADMDSSPIIAGGKLYVGSEKGAILCLQPEDGKILWRHEVDTAPTDPPGGRGVESTCTVVDGRVYAGCYQGWVYCLDANTGKRLWKFKTDDDTDSSVCISRDSHGEMRAVVGCESGILYCFSAKTGQALWQVTTGAGIWSSPAIVGDRVWVGSDDGHLYCIDLLSGQVVWKQAVGSVWSSPCVLGDRVVFGSRDHNFYVLDAGDGRIVSKLTLGGHCISTPCVVDGDIYLGSHGGDFHRLVPA